MKKLSLLVILPLFFIFISSPTQSLAADAMVSPTPTPVEYTLPYPGILPDNPLYKIKTFRDKLISFLISDPLKKAEFDLLQSDKRLAGAMYLLQNNSQKNAALAIDTISKGENYVSEGIAQMQLAKKQGEDVREMMGNYATSNKKHLQVVMDLEKTIPTSLQENLHKEQKRIEGFQKMVNPSM